MNAHVLDEFFGREVRRGVVVGLPAGNDVDKVSPTRQVPCEIAENLACGGMVGVEESIDEEDLAHAMCRDGVCGTVHRNRHQRTAPAVLNANASMTKGRLLRMVRRGG